MQSNKLQMMMIREKGRNWSDSSAWRKDFDMEVMTCERNELLVKQRDRRTNIFWIQILCSTEDVTRKESLQGKKHRWGCEETKNGSFEKTESLWWRTLKLSNLSQVHYHNEVGAYENQCLPNFCSIFTTVIWERRKLSVWKEAFMASKRLQRFGLKRSFKNWKTMALQKWEQHPEYSSRKK